MSAGSDEPAGAGESQLASFLVRSRDELLGFLGREAGRLLLRYESPEDLVQGIHVEALRSETRFDYRSGPEAHAWLFRIARRYLTQRRAHWLALKRDSGRMLRLDWSRSGEPGSGGLNPAATATGPSTFASRREQLTMAAKALALLLPRDQDILTSSAQGYSIEELAGRLDLSYDAAERARLRALERFRKAWRVVETGQRPGRK